MAPVSIIFLSMRRPTLSAEVFVQVSIVSRGIALKIAICKGNSRAKMIRAPKSFRDRSLLSTLATEKKIRFYQRVLCNCFTNVTEASLTDNTTSPAKVSIKSQCYGTSIIHLTHTNVGTRKAARQRGGGWRRRSQLPGRNRSQRPRASFFKRRHAGETGSERSSFRDNNRSCTPAQSKNMGG